MSDRNTSIRRSQLKPIRYDDFDAIDVPADGEVPSYDSATGKFEWISTGGGGASGQYLEKSIAQAAHGLSVGDLVRHDGTSFVKAKADSSTNAEVIGIVSEEIDSNNFKLLYAGYIDLGSGAGLTAGEVYFLSPVTSGTYTSTEPTNEGQITKPIFIAVSETEAYFFNMRGSEVESIGDYTVGGYSTSFDNGDLGSGNILTVNHNLNVNYPIVVIYDNNDKVIEPDEIEYTDNNNVDIDLNSFVPLTGTWHVRIVGGSGVQTSIADSDGDTKIQTEESADEDIIRFDIEGTEKMQMTSSGISGAYIKDEDNMSSDSDQHLATQQSIKAYVDSVATHDRLHDIDSTDDHNGVAGAVENNFIAFDDNGLPKDSGHKDSDYADSSHTHNEVDITDLGSYLENLVEDTTPQLGGDLDLNGHNIDFPSVSDISDCLDEDDMSSDSATALATQQSIKKYVDDNVGVDAGEVGQSELENYAAGDYLLISADTEVDVTATSYTKQKEIHVVRNGTIRFKWTTAGTNGTFYTKIYRNGVAVGTEHTLRNGTSSEDISGWSPGDLAQLYAKISGVTNAKITNFRLYLDRYTVEKVIID